MRVDEASGQDAHVTDLLALYHLDVLDRRRAEQAGRHLESCGDCRLAATEVCETLAALALLSDERDDLLNAYGALGAAKPPAFPARFAPPEPPGEPGSIVRRVAEPSDARRFRLRRRGRSTETVDPVEESDEDARKDRLKPAAVLPPPPALHTKVAPPATAPGARQAAARRTGNLVRLSVLLLVSVAAAGISMKTLFNSEKSAPPAAVALSAVATASDRETGADLSVFLTQKGDHVTARATVNGLHAGIGYRLVGYTFDGRQRPVVNWTGRHGLQEVTGELPVRVADISHFVVTRDTKVIVTVYLPR